MSEDDKVRNLETYMYGTPNSPGLIRRMDRIESQLNHLVEIEQKRSARQDKIFTAILTFAALQFIGFVAFLAIVGAKTHMMTG
jgi:uncharacterized BrkB/YihY/UPF0761 family membrane protein